MSNKDRFISDKNTRNTQMHLPTCILFLTHFINQEVLDRFWLLHDSCGEAYDVYFALNDETGNDLACLHEYKTFTFTCDEILSQGYTPHGNQVMHNVNYVMQLFRKRHPEYTYYWKVEYDVAFTGEWLTLFSYYEDNDADFISSHIERYTKMNKVWHWWYDTDWKDTGITPSQCVKSFNPVVRISGKALDFMDSFLKRGITGHFEVTESTALFLNGFQLLDMGGTGDFSDPKFPNHFYVQGKGINAGTMRWRPEFLPTEVEAFTGTNKIFHPLKA